VVANLLHMARNMHLGRKECQVTVATVQGRVGKKALSSVDQDAAQRPTYLLLLGNEVVDVRFTVPPAATISSTSRL